MKKVQSTLNSENQELDKLRIKKQNIGLLIESGEKGLRVAACLNEEKQVAENILELRVTQTEEMMRNTSNRVYNLERCRLQIHAVNISNIKYNYIKIIFFFNFNFPRQ